MPRQLDWSTIDFNKGNGLIPAIIQDASTQQVLMLGYMNEAALKRTLELQQVTFYSRSKERLWTKGESSGNTLELVDILQDCDGDALLVKALPKGPTCHTGADTCFDEVNKKQDFLYQLEAIIQDRKQNPQESAYTSKLFKKGINKVAQKVGEEAVELVIEAKDDNDELFLNEAADLMYHYLVLLTAKNKQLEDVIDILTSRHAKKQ